MAESGRDRVLAIGKAWQATVAKAKEVAQPAPEQPAPEGDGDKKGGTP